MLSFALSLWMPLLLFISNWQWAVYISRPVVAISSFISLFVYLFVCVCCVWKMSRFKWKKYARFSMILENQCMWIVQPVDQPNITCNDITFTARHPKINTNKIILANHREAAHYSLYAISYGAWICASNWSNVIWCAIERNQYETAYCLDSVQLLYSDNVPHLVVPYLLRCWRKMKEQKKKYGRRKKQRNTKLTVSCHFYSYSYVYRRIGRWISREIMSRHQRPGWSLK